MDIKKILIILVSLFFPVQAFAIQPITSGTLSYANTRIAGNQYSAGGPAFIITNLAGTGVDLSPYVGYKIVITDSASKSRVGYIKSVGTSEILGNESITGWPTNSGYETLTVNANGHDIDSAVNSSGSGEARSNNTNPAIKSAYLVKIALNLSLNSGTAPKLYCTNSSGIGPLMKTLINGTDTIYWTIVDDAQAYWDLYNSVNQNWSLLFSVKQVTAPSSTGVNIVSSHDGSTYQWESVDLGFNYNDTAGYSYTIYPGAVHTTISDASTYSYGLIDCADFPGVLGVDVTGEATILNYDVVRCPAGSFQFEESATLKNSIGISEGADIIIANGKTVEASNNLFEDSEKSGSGTYSDAGLLTKWNSDPLFQGTETFCLQSTSPAINAGTDVGLTTDFLGNSIIGIPDIGAYEFQDSSAPTTTASLNTGTYSSAQTVTLTCADTSGMGCDKTYYTTNGSTPTTSSAEYSSPISISTTTTLKFFSTDLAGNSESTKTKIYTISTSIEKAKIKSEDNQKLEDKVSVKDNEITLKQSDSALANGQIKIYKKGKLWKTILADYLGAWKKTLKLKDDFSGWIKLKFFNSSGVQIGSQKAKIKVDTENPNFTSFPPENKIIYLNYQREENRTLTFKAEDNQIIKKYKIKFNGKTKTKKITKKNQDKIQSYLVSKDTKPGTYSFKVTAYDEAGNKTKKEVNVVVR